jgi:hypothetical protein
MPGLGLMESHVATAVKEWLEEILPDLAIVYPHITAGKGALPDAAIDVQAKRVVPEDLENFPFRQLQQSWLRVFPVEISILTALEPADLPTVEEQSADVEFREQAQLRGFGAIIETSIWADTSLGDRVYMCSPRLEIDYTAPFVEYDDGTRGRQMAVSIVICEPIELAA